MGREIPDSTDNSKGLWLPKHYKEEITTALESKGSIVSCQSTPNREGGKDREVIYDDGTRYAASMYGNEGSDNIVLALHGMMPYRQVRHNQYNDAEFLDHAQYRTLDVLPHLDGRDPEFNKFDRGFNAENYDYITRTYLAGFIKRLQSHTGVERISLEGISKGGYDSVTYSALFPENINKQLLVSPSGIQERIPAGFSRAQLDIVLKQLPGWKALVRRIAYKRVGLTKGDLSTESKEHIVDAVGAFAKNFSASKRLSQAIQSLDKDNTLRLLRKIKDDNTSTYLVGSKDDPITPIQTIETYQKELGLPKNKVNISDDGGHAIPLSLSNVEKYNRWRLEKLLGQ